jgi:hypothetical protein
LASRWKENGSFHCPAVAAKTNNNNSNSNLCQCGDPNCCGTTQLATILMMMVLAAMDVPSVFSPSAECQGCGGQVEEAVAE